MGRYDAVCFKRRCYAGSIKGHKPYDAETENEKQDYFPMKEE